MNHNETTSASAISVRDITIGYGSRIIMQNISFEVPQGQIVCLLGGSGCGKSTLLKHIIGLYPPMSGDILLLGESIVTADRDKKRDIMAKFGVAYQGGALFRSMSILENIELVLEERTNLSASERRERAKQKLALVNLEGREDFMPSDLSGGMIKRAAFARALALDPKLLFFDEPSAGLDPISSANLDQLILSIRKETGATIMMVTHELPSIYTVADRVIVLDAKTKGIIGDDTPQNLRDHSEDSFVREFMNRCGTGKNKATVQL